MRIKKFERETGPLAPFWSKSRQFRAAKTNATSVATSSFSLLCFAFFPFLFYPQKKVLPPSPSLTKKNFGRVVKALDLKSNGFYPRRFEPCSQRVDKLFWDLLTIQVFPTLVKINGSHLPAFILK